MIDFGKMPLTTLLAVVLVGLGSLFFLGSLINRDPEAETALFPTPASIAVSSDEVTAEAMNEPAVRATAPYVDTNNPQEVALGGEYGNGGVWAWDDIANLMVVYNTSDALVSVLHDGQRYEGVPLAYLLAYSSVYSGADMIVITGQNNEVHAVPVSFLQNCADCILSSTGAGLVAILPGFEPRFINNVRRLDATTTAEANRKLAEAAEAERLANTPNIRLYGLIEGADAWTWDDISNLLGVYDSYGNFQQRTVNGVTYGGVPVSYLMHYAQMDDTANTVRATFRGRQEYAYRFNQPDDLSNLLIAQDQDGNFALLVTTQQGTEVLPSLVNLQAEFVAMPVVISDDPQTITLAGNFQSTGRWSWADIANLMAEYEEYGARHTVELHGTVYSGVPLQYLLNFASITNFRTGILSIYTRDGLRQNMPLRPIRTCQDCVIAPATDGTLTLVLPGQAPDLIPELAGLEVP